MNNRVVSILTGVVALLVFLIGAGAFVLSYDALYATGQQHGSFVTGKMWIFPLLIDAPLVVFTLALLISQITLCANICETTLPKKLVYNIEGRGEKDVSKRNHSNQSQWHRPVGSTRSRSGRAQQATAVYSGR